MSALGNQQPNSVEVYVADAVGDRYCHSCSNLEYEQQAIKHARWWMRQRNHPGAARPFRLVVSRYYDPSHA